jgi:hypothetical protein
LRFWPNAKRQADNANAAIKAIDINLFIITPEHGNAPNAFSGTTLPL